MKHPVLNNRIRLLVWWLVWLLLGLGQTLLFYFASGSFNLTSVIDSLISILIFSAIALALWYPFYYFNSEEVKITSLISNLLASGAISVSLWILITKFFILLILTDEAEYLKYWDATFAYRIGSGVLIFVMVILTYFLFVSLFNLSEKKAKEARLESLVKETELKLLRSQINPHFLFNSLNSISYLTISDPDGARDMIIKLSEFMRYALSKKDDQPVTLRSELENLRLYLEIERVRFGDRLSIEENIDAACLETKMPVMLLQPLYENAIKHGVYESTEGVKVNTEVILIDNHIKITISNNYDIIPSVKKGTGTGLLNVERRLELFFGKNASIKSEKENGLYTVTLYIPTDFL